MNRQTAENPLTKLDDWDDFVASRYKENKGREEFRNYDPNVNPGVAEFYRLNHALQTVDFVHAKEREYLPLQKEQKTIWEAAEFLNTLVDDSDPAHTICTPRVRQNPTCLKFFRIIRT